MTVTNESINLELLLKHRAIQTHFQPIVSIRKQTVIGLEALSRGVSPSNELIMPHPLFAIADAKEKSVELDRLCREKALENYKKRLGLCQVPQDAGRSLSRSYVNRISL